MKQPKRKTVELVHSSYQPTKTELHEEFDADLPGDTAEDRMAYLGRALTRDVKIRWIEKPRSRR